MQRLDKVLSDAKVGTRKEAKELVKRRRIAVNGATATSAEMKVDPEKDLITLDGNLVALKRRIVCMMNKPSGYVTSTDDPHERTVMELLPEEFLKQDVVPIGRLDKDTEGLLLFTNDGDLVHRLISPNSNIEKTYYAKHEGIATQEDAKAFANGIILKDGTLCKSARLQILSDGECEVTVTEGMYHQVRRMMASRGLHVTYLQRIREAGLELGTLESGKTVEVQL